MAEILAGIKLHTRSEPMKDTSHMIFSQILSPQRLRNIEVATPHHMQKWAKVYVDDVLTT